GERGMHARKRLTGVSLRPHVHSFQDVAFAVSEVFNSDAGLSKTFLGSYDLLGGFVKKMGHAQVAARHVEMRVKRQGPLETFGGVFVKSEEPTDAAIVPVERLGRGCGYRKAVAVGEGHSVSLLRRFPDEQQRTENWIPVCTGMTKTTTSVIPGEQRETRNPGLNERSLVSSGFC